MSLSFTHLGTGSRGNATLVESGDFKVLIDQGFSGKQLETRLARMEIKPNEIDAIVLTHHHGDHGGGASIAPRKKATASTRAVTDRWNPTAWVCTAICASSPG